VTATAARTRSRTRPGTRKPANGRRTGIVYGIRVIHPLTGQIVLGYVGQTRQRLRAREGQHRDDQPWSDTIVGEAFVIAQGMWNKAELDWYEQVCIQRMLPLYNIDHNRANPYRIKPWDAIAQRQAREPGWTPNRRPATPYPRFAPYIGWGWKQWRRVVLVAIWLTLACLLWWAGADVWRGWDGPLYGGIGSTVVVVASLLAWRLQRPKRRRRRRR
jgi:hypothetical protein